MTVCISFCVFTKDFKNTSVLTLRLRRVPKTEHRVHSALLRGDAEERGAETFRMPQVAILACSSNSFVNVLFQLFV